MAYKTIIGLEIHVELSTKTKAFCSCENAYGGEPNTRVCPVCLAMPGALPVLNREVVESAMKIAKAFHMEVMEKSTFDRKNYFYPDLTKGFQITQNEHPVAKNGYIEVGEEQKKIRIHHIQMEEDTGKSLHTEEGTTLMDYNRCGVPLIEIVTEPDLNSEEEVREFLETLRKTLKSIGVSDVKMEEGSLRCDVNINLKDEESGKRTAITEVKNLNSFRGVEKCILYEIDRQSELLKAGEEEIRTTRRWDDVERETVIMRVKYTANDYRFAPEGDLGPVYIDEAWKDSVWNNMPETAQEKKERFMESYALSAYDAEVLTNLPVIADFYEEVSENFKDYNLLSNWVMTEVLRRIDVEDEENIAIPFSSADFTTLMNTIKDGKINNNAGKKVLRTMFETGDEPMKIIERESLLQMEDDSEMKSMVEEAIAENPQTIEEYRAGKDRVLGFLVGQVMKKSKGKANPQKVNEMILEILKSE